MKPGEFIPPMLAQTAPVPFSDDDWWYEIKWDGFRAIISRGSELHIYSRQGQELLRHYPVLKTLEAQLPDPVVLDAELVAWTPEGPSFSGLMSQDPHTPLMLMVFDCLYSHGRWHLEKPLAERQQRLREAIIPGGLMMITDGVAGAGEAYFAAVKAEGLEGVLAKRLNSPYRPGRRTDYWRKFIAWQAGWFWAISQKQVEDGRWYWTVAERTNRGQWHVVTGVPVPAGIPVDPTVTLLSPPIAVELLFRERTREGRLRHAKLRQWRFTDSPSGAHPVSPDRTNPPGSGGILPPDGSAAVDRSRK
ncbi:MAG: DNA ligase [Sulfobacillus sp.]|nr:DNA ligase [Sulfobacillus sp.]